MDFQLQFRPYRRPFQRPLQTHHGEWHVRAGIILRLVDAEGRVGWGEIAPLEAFGTESLAQALDFCQTCQTKIQCIAKIPDSLPACQFGLEAAWHTLQAETADAPTPVHPSRPCCYLLPTGEAALTAWQPLWHRGVRTFKWKIGVVAYQQERHLFGQLVTTLPAGAQLRLDANGGLDLPTAQRWLAQCDQPDTAPAIEFLEQPLPVQDFASMLHLSQQFQTPIALDESVATVADLEACHQRGWRGIVVIKAAIIGSPRRLHTFCRTHAPDVVWSSVFETSIARHYIEQYLIPTCDHSQRALGFGVEQWFADDLAQLEFEQLWQSL